MPKRREEYEEDKVEIDAEDEIEIQEEKGKSKRGRSSSSGRGSNSKRRKLKAAEEEEEEGGGGGRPFRTMFVDDEGEEEDDEYEEDGFIDNEEPEFDDEVDHNSGGVGGRRMRYVPLEEDIEELEKRIHDRFSVQREEYEDDSEVGQQVLIPGVKDPKLWLVMCGIGKEREVAGCLMQKCFDNFGELQIMSAFALDHLKGFAFAEAHKEAHVREACKGLRHVMLQRIILVPIKEMTDVLSGERKSVVYDKWVRIKTGIYRGDLAKIVEHVAGRQHVRVKVIPRLDLQALANGVESVKKNESGGRPECVPALVKNMELLRLVGVRAVSTRDPLVHGYVEKIDGLSGMMFKDGFHLKVVSDRSLKDAKPTFQELEEFRELNGDGDQTVPNRKKGESFMNGNAVVVTEGDLRSLVGDGLTKLSWVLCISNLTWKTSQKLLPLNNLPFRNALKMGSM